MPFDWAELLSVADLLHAHASNGVIPEANHRSAIGRTYYAAYGHALRYSIAKLGFASTQTSDDHTNLRKHLQGRRHSGVATKLETLRQWRNAADYESELKYNDFGLVYDSARKMASGVIQQCKL